MLNPMYLVLVAAIIVVLASVRRIPEGHAYTLRRVGGHMRTVGSGVHIVLPVLERVAHRIRLLGNVVDVDATAVQTGALSLTEWGQAPSYAQQDRAVV